MTSEEFAQKQIEVFQNNQINPSSKVASLIRGRAWDKGHAYGLEEVLAHTESLCEFVTEVMQAFFSEILPNKQIF